MSNQSNIIFRQPIQDGVTLALDLQPGKIFNQKSRKFHAKRVKTKEKRKNSKHNRKKTKPKGKRIPKKKTKSADATRGKGSRSMRKYLEAEKIYRAESGKPTQLSEKGKKALQQLRLFTLKSRGNKSKFKHLRKGKILSLY